LWLSFLILVVRSTLSRLALPGHLKHDPSAEFLASDGETAGLGIGQPKRTTA
jgi:hypothetical protein